MIFKDKSEILTWLAAGDPFPPVTQAWDAHSPAPGLLAAGGALDVASLQAAYGQGIFPWYSAGQPILWWSPDPRMVLQTAQFKLHRSLRKAVQRFMATPGCAIRFDSDFAQVIRQCAARGRALTQEPANAQPSTWILPEMVAAYTALHHAGLAHSVETWLGDELVGGLYLVNIGGAVFGESMFSRRTDASKIALAALVAFCRAQGLAWIDCQQNTGHLASLGAAEMPRAVFLAGVQAVGARAAPLWRFEPLYWHHILPPSSIASHASAEPLS
jgi:leucyl/phenylalanyl-tRNA---protein transferase